jgi:hypothetical protein
MCSVSIKNIKTSKLSLSILVFLGSHNTVSPIKVTGTTVNDRGIVTASISENSSLSLRQKSVHQFLVTDVTKAEILWCLRTVMNHISIRTSAACVSTLSL